MRRTVTLHLQTLVRWRVPVYIAKITLIAALVAYCVGGRYRLFKRKLVRLLFFHHVSPGGERMNWEAAKESYKGAVSL